SIIRRPQKERGLTRNGWRRGPIPATVMHRRPPKQITSGGEAKERGMKRHRDFQLGRLVAVALVGVACGAAEKPESLWANLRSLHAGQKIQVVQVDLKAFAGEFVSVSDESISLKTGGAEKTIARTDIVRVSRTGGKRARNVWIAAAVGGGAFAAVGAA